MRDSWYGQQLQSETAMLRRERDQARAAVAKVEQERDEARELGSRGTKYWFDSWAEEVEKMTEARRLARRYFRAYHRTRRALTEAEIEAADLTLQVESLTRQRDELAERIEQISATFNQRVIDTGPVVTFDPPPQYVYSNLSDGGEVAE